MAARYRHQIMTAFTIPNNNDNEGWEIIEEVETSSEPADENDSQNDDDDDKIWEIEDLKNLPNRDVKLLMQFMKDYTY